MHFNSILKENYVFPNGVNVSAMKLELLNDLARDSRYDREYINKAFTVMFSEKYLLKYIRSGMTRKDLLEKLRQKKRYNTIKAIKLKIGFFYFDDNYLSPFL